MTSKPSTIVAVALAAAAAAAATAATIGAVAGTKIHQGRISAAAAPAVAAKPTGMQLFGAAGVTLAVPDTWSTRPDPCGFSSLPSIQWDIGPQSCPRTSGSGKPHSGILAGTVAAMMAAGPLQPPATWASATSPAGVRYEQAPGRALPGTTGWTTRWFRFPGQDLMLLVSQAPKDHHLLEDLTASFASLPTGHVAVPFATTGETAKHAEARLRAAGLTLRVVRAAVPSGRHVSVWLVDAISLPDGAIVTAGTRVTVRESAVFDG